MGPEHACAADFVTTTDNLGPLGGGELYRGLLIYLDGGGIAVFRDEFAEVGPFDPQEKQEQDLVLDEKQLEIIAARLS